MSYVAARFELRSGFYEQLKFKSPFSLFNNHAHITGIFAQQRSSPCTYHVSCDISAISVFMCVCMCTRARACVCIYCIAAKYTLVPVLWNGRGFQYSYSTCSLHCRKDCTSIQCLCFPISAVTIFQRLETQLKWLVVARRVHKSSFPSQWV